MRCSQPLQGVQPYFLMTNKLRFNSAGFPGLVDDGADVELSRTTSLGAEFTGAHRVALFVRRFRRERGDEFLEAWITPQRIEHRIDPEQRRSKRPQKNSATSVRYRE